MVKPREDLLERMKAIERQMASIEERIAKAYPLHIKRKWKKCGKKCHCQRGVLHGPYLYAYVNDPEVRERRRKGRKTTRKEVYLGLSWTPPEGWLRPRELQELIRQHRSLREELEYLRGLVYGA